MFQQAGYFLNTTNCTHLVGQTDHILTKNLSIEDWWSQLAEVASPNGKGMASLTLLVVWEIWKERNA
jgi:hypothetical protein